MLVKQDSNKAIAIWLFAVAALVFSMVILGGVTRYMLGHANLPVLMNH